MTQTRTLNGHATHRPHKWASHPIKCFIWGLIKSALLRDYFWFVCAMDHSQQCSGSISKFNQGWLSVRKVPQPRYYFWPRLFVKEIPASLSYRLNVVESKREFCRPWNIRYNNMIIQCFWYIYRIPNFLFTFSLTQRLETWLPIIPYYFHYLMIPTLFLPLSILLYLFITI